MDTDTQVEILVNPQQQPWRTTLAQIEAAGLRPYVAVTVYPDGTVGVRWVGGQPSPAPWVEVTNYMPERRAA